MKQTILVILIAVMLCGCEVFKGLAGGVVSYGNRVDIQYYDTNMVDVKVATHYRVDGWSRACIMYRSRKFDFNNKEGIRAFIAENKEVGNAEIENHKKVRDAVKSLKEELCD